MSDTIELPRLSNNTREYVGRVPFDEDKLDRKKLAEKLTTYLDRLNDGAVLAIDAPWGEGKTWFARNWEADLKEKDYKTIYIDAFEQDYVDEPFILLASELMEIIKENGSANDNKKFKKTATQIAKSTLSIGAKVGINLATRIILGNVDLNEEIEKSIEEVGSSSADNVSKFIEDKFDNYKNEKEANVEFKKVLNAYSSKQEKPIVIFIDELDRCKPTFAVSLIERIKHYFDVPNVVFILLLNKEQLENAIKGVYGINTDASKYLDKFINFYFNLPRQNKEDHRTQYKIENFIKVTMQKYSFTKSNDNDSFMKWLEYWSGYFNLSLRDLEKCVALYAFAYPTNAAYLLVYFIILKVKQPKLFNMLMNNDIKAQSEAKQQMEDIIKIYMKENNVDEKNIDKSLTFYFDLHNSYIDNDFKDFGTKYSEYFKGLHIFSIKDFFKSLMRKIDIDMER
jgi:hypothetical protein